MRTIAAVLREIDKPLVIEELTLPDLSRGQVLVSIQSAGLCQTQINEMRGRKGPDKYLPHTMGHEGYGMVEAVGADVSKVRPGDNVVMTWIKGSGLDVPGCVYGSANGKVNSGAVSCFLQHAVVSENRLVPVAPMDPMIAPLLGCAALTGAGMVLNQLQPAMQNSIAIFGCGGVGLCAILAAKSMQCGNIIAVDINSRKLEFAHNCGSTHEILATGGEIALIKAVTDGKGADFAIESSGSITAMEKCIDATRSKGRVLLAGNPPHGQFIRIDPFVLIAGKRIEGSWGGGCDPDRDVPRLSSMFKDNRFHLEKIASHHVIDLNNINKAFELMESGTVSRVVLKIA